MAKAVKLAHEKYPEYLIGDMNVFMTKYPFTCNPEDVLATQKEMRIMNWFCSDVQVRGEYPAYMERYFETDQGVREYMTDVVAKAEQDGYVQTLMHRRRALPELKSSNFNMREFGKRVALNMPVQGTAADIMKLAMVRVHHRLKREGLRARLLMQVHDELIVECPASEREQAERLLTEEMEQAAQLSVPLIAEAHSGKNWLAAKE